MVSIGFLSGIAIVGDLGIDVERPKLADSRPMRISQLRLFHLFAGGSSRSEHPKVPDFSHGWRPVQDEFRNVLGQECARNVAGDSFYELRRNLNNERVRIALEAVFVTDAVIHMGMSWPVVWRLLWCRSTCTFVE
jgi:hypothetical protein